MFTQKLSMDCTKEQYEKYLKDELLKMGYVKKAMYWMRSTPVFTNAANGVTGGMLDIEWESKERYGRTYLGSFNAPLFLALAAMTDNPIGIDEEYYTNGRNLIIRKFVLIKTVSIDGVFRKATKKEIMAKFSKTQADITYDAAKEFVEYFSDKANTLKGVAISDNISFDATELESEMSRIVDELWDSIEKSHIDALKSKGYKILKPKTWEEV